MQKSEYEGGKTMTHPDILKMERFGEAEPTPEPRRIGECGYCGAPLYDHMAELAESADGLFCDLECCHSYYEICSL